MDLRGRGHSPATPSGSYGWDAHARDVLEIANLCLADSFDVVGHSMGGFVGMALAARYPDRCRRLVLLDVAGMPEPRAVVSIGRSLHRLGRGYVNEQDALSYPRAAGTVSWNTFWENYFTWELVHSRGMVRIRTDAEAVAEDAACASADRVYALWSRLRCPVLLVRATLEMATGGLVVTDADAARFTDIVADASVVDVRADHYSILTDPPAITAIERHLSKNPS
jgi:pimeloyl-ACP methyl ester carboxylesterase